MAEGNKAFKNLDYAVNSVLNEIGDYGTTQYQRLLQFGVEGYRELNLYDYPQIKVVYLELNDNLTVDLPEDFVSYSKIGLCIGGQVYTLSINENLCLPRKEDECGQPLTAREMSQFESDRTLFTDNNILNTFGDIGYGYYFASHFRNGQYIGEIFGVGGGYNTAYYRIDQERHQIAFTGAIPQGEIVLEYISTGVSMDGSATIPVQALDPVKKYMHWKRVEYDRQVPLAEKARREQQYEKAIVKFRAFNLAFTMSEYFDKTYRTYRNGPHR